MTSADNPSSRRPPDPFELWRQIYDTNERAWNAVLERTVNNPAFAESSGKILETFLSAQKTVRDNMRMYLEQINVPTREDISRLGELILSLEEKVDQLDDRLAGVETVLREQAAADAAEQPAASDAQATDRQASTAARSTEHRSPARARRQSSSREATP